MFKTKFLVSITIFITFLIFTSTIKNKTRFIEKQTLNLNSKILLKEKNLNKSQLEFFYLTSPAELEKKLNIIGIYNYQPIIHSKIYFDISDLVNIQNKTSNLNDINEKKIKKK
jgi:lipopolysaccharide export LptBFGC system permease protein LptF